MQGTTTMSVMSVMRVVMDETDLRMLRERMGDAHLGARLRGQVDRAQRLHGMGRGGFHFENLSLFTRSIGAILRLSGLDRLGRRNALALTVRERVVTFPGLPAAFDGLRILHLSDLHLDGYPGFGRHIAQAVHGRRFDVAVVTGDFRFHDTGRYAHISHELEALLPTLACRFGVYGVLGNHDFVEMVPLLERAGIRLLLNEAVPLCAGEDRLWLVGLDDPHFYGQHDFTQALRSVPPHAPRILLVHSPEVIPEAAAHGFGLYLAGHTHGGQMCLPGGIALYRNAHCRRQHMVGAWRYGQMQGYTSAGTGSSGVFARFFCPPEIIIHELHIGE